MTETRNPNMITVSLFIFSFTLGFFFNPFNFVSLAGYIYNFLCSVLSYLTHPIRSFISATLYLFI